MIDRIKFERRSGEKISLLSDAFYGLVGSITSRSPSVSGLIEKTKVMLTEVELETISFIKKNTTPEELVEIIFLKPPTVFAKTGVKHDHVVALKPDKFIFTNPSVLETETAKKETYLPDDIKGDSRKFLEEAIVYCKKYLLAPKRFDGFTDHHNQRDPWLRGIFDVLKLITEDKTNPESGNWDTPFRDSWFNNRYAGTTRNKIFMAVDFSLLDTIPVLLKAKLEHIREKLKYASDTFDKGEVDKGVDLIANECINIILMFSANSEANEL